jgi:hypothetical protein
MGTTTTADSEALGSIPNTGGRGEKKEKYRRYIYKSFKSTRSSPKFVNKSFSA